MKKYREMIATIAYVIGVMGLAYLIIYMFNLDKGLWFYGLGFVLLGYPGFKKVLSFL